MSEEKIPVFDIGDTLTPAKQFSKRFFKEELRRQGIEKEVEYTFGDYNEFVVEDIQEWLYREGVQDADAARIVERYRERKEEEMENRGVFEMLRKVNRNFPATAILSDNTLQAKRFFQEIFERHDVEVDAFLVSEEIDILKPDSRIFEELIDRLDVEPSRCVYFGNRGDKDAACVDTGMNFVWVTQFETFGTDWNGVRIDELTYENIAEAMKEVEN
ncbi:MAG: HAD family hydrolase [Candidatus Nanosalina sp.]